MRHSSDHKSISNYGDTMNVCVCWRLIWLVWIGMKLETEHKFHTKSLGSAIDTSSKGLTPTDLYTNWIRCASRLHPSLISTTILYFLAFKAFTIVGVKFPNLGIHSASLAICWQLCKFAEVRLRSVSAGRAALFFPFFLVCFSRSPPPTWNAQSPIKCRKKERRIMLVAVCVF